MNKHHINSQSCKCWHSPLAAQALRPTGGLPGNRGKYIAFQWSAPKHDAVGALKVNVWTSLSTSITLPAWQSYRAVDFAHPKRKEKIFNTRPGVTFTHLNMHYKLSAQTNMNTEKILLCPVNFFPASVFVCALLPFCNHEPTRLHRQFEYANVLSACLDIVTAHSLIFTNASEAAGGHKFYWYSA